MQGATYPLASSSTLGALVLCLCYALSADAASIVLAYRALIYSCSCPRLNCLAECKRRKIKCDRANPCGPCVRRGEQAKCQWHVIEPMEKYVTRSEFDELKARVAELEATLMRTLSGSSPPAPTSRRSSMSATMSMTSGHPAEPVHGTAIMPYQAYSAASAAPYPPRPGSPRSPTRGEPPPFYRHPPPTAGRSPTSGPQLSAAPSTSHTATGASNAQSRPQLVSTSSSSSSGRSHGQDTPGEPSTSHRDHA
ncbi:hypothetical protein FKP32DRAFT_1590616 [Trametes sanguinea]|nr:hypothetical protein FKP32DRAFT_1590616 [Trametes sanguinea]